MLATVLAVTGLLLSTGAALQAAYSVSYDFETAWAGDYAPGWDLEGYRMGDAPVAKMQQIDLTALGRTGYGAKVYVDSVPADWYFWAAVHADYNPTAMEKQYNPWMSVFLKDEYSTITKSLGGVLWTVPSLVTGDEDWTDTYFGGPRPDVTDKSNYYYTARPDGHTMTTVDRDDGWHLLKMQLSSADGKIHYSLDGTEVGTSGRSDYLDLGAPILGVFFETPLSGWGDNKPYAVFDNMEIGSNLPEPATMAFLALGGIGMLLRRRRGQ
jgi:hypothetical protein